METTEPIWRGVSCRPGVAVAVLLGFGLALADGASAQAITEFPIPTAQSYPWGITPGPGGNLWFTESTTRRIGRITPTGVITEFGPLTSPCQLTGIVAGPDGNLWFADWAGNRIGRITPAGAITTFALPVAYSGPWAIAAGPDGNVWFTEVSGGRIGRITPSGVITEFGISPVSAPAGIAAGADGNLWFTERNLGRIGRITPSGVITEFPIPTSGGGPAYIAAGPDGNLWFTEVFGNMIGRITPGGVVTEFAIPSFNSWPLGITAGADGNLWFVEDVVNQIGRITPAGVITEFPIPTSDSSPYEITNGPDGNLWFTEWATNTIGRLTPPLADLSVTKTNDVSSVSAGGRVTYTIEVSNAGPAPAMGAHVIDTLPAALLGVSWACSASAGSSCATVSGSGDIDDEVSLLAAGIATFTISATVQVTAVGILENTATVSPPVGFTDPVPGNDTATDTDTILTPVFLSVGDASPTEGDSGTSAASFAVTLSPSSGATVSVGYATVAGTATPGLDYQATSGMLVFSPGETSQAIPVPIVGDTLAEPDEAFYVVLYDPTNALMGDGHGLGTILDDDGGGGPGAGLPNELMHGAESRSSLGALPGPVADEEIYLVDQRPYSSYEAVVDEISGDLQPLEVERLGGDGTTILQSSHGVSGVGAARSLRWINAGASAVSDETVRVRSGGCTTDCGSEDTYRLRFYETTCSIARFNNAGTQITVLALQNPGEETVTGTVYFWSSAGVLLGSAPFSLGSKATSILNTAAVSGVSGQSGAITVAHDGRYGELSGKTVALEPATGFSFDSPILWRAVR